MLKSLYIENFAIISNLSIEWSDGLNIVTGQTGAGKSIILGALSLLSGKKADASYLMDKEKNLVVEAVFSIKGFGVETILSENEIDYADDILIRRQISPNGKSRCFIEDCPVSQSVLSSVAEKLIDIHSQNQSLLLSKEEFQMNLLDSIAGSNKLKAECEKKYSDYSQSLRKKNQLKKEVEETLREADFLQYQIDQIDNLKLSDGEVQMLEEKLSVIEHSEDIAKSISRTYGFLDGDDNAISSTIHSQAKTIKAYGKYMDKLSNLADRLESSALELKDIACDLDTILSSLTFDENEKNRVESRLDEINSIMAKHNVSSEKQLLQFNIDMKSRLQSIEEKQQLLSKLEKFTEENYESLEQSCSNLTKKRRQSLDCIKKYVVDSLSMLGIDKAKFNVDLLPKSPSPDGQDEIQFLFSANELSPVQPIGKNASGGELSRLMLALKSLAAKNLKLPTIIFDEIDTGVSGAIADAMGEMIGNMADSMQIINITHLPQVAAKGVNHFEVFKKDSQTQIVKLSKQQRVLKIAEMISGANVTDAALNHAKLLLGYNCDLIDG